MSTYLTANIILILSVFLYALAQLFMKIGAAAVGEPSAGMIGWITSFWSPTLAAGYFFQFLALILWIQALKTLDLSYAYAFLSLNLLFVALLSWGYLGETISVMRWVGFAVTIGGLLIVARS